MQPETALNRDNLVGNSVMTPAQAVTHYRTLANLSRAQLARAAGLPCETVRTVERGKHTPRLTTIQALARALGVRDNQIMTELREG
jgi:transcriptional regulator with XRE-family HTH domain